MAIDLDALNAATCGDPEAKVSVKRKWLIEVHKELTELRKLRTQHRLGDRFADIGEKLCGFTSTRPN